MRRCRCRPHADDAESFIERGGPSQRTDPRSAQDPVGPQRCDSACKSHDGTPGPSLRTPQGQLVELRGGGSCATHWKKRSTATIARFPTSVCLHTSSATAARATGTAAPSSRTPATTACQRRSGRRCGRIASSTAPSRPTAAARCDRLKDERTVGERRQQKNAGCARIARDRPQHLKPVELRQLDVEDGDVRRELPDRGQGLPPVRRLGHQLEAGEVPNGANDPFAIQGVVVRNEHSDRAGACRHRLVLARAITE